MKSNLSESPFKPYSKIPKSWPARPKMINYDKADPSIHYEDGWREVTYPEYDAATHKLGLLIFDEESDQFTYEVVAKTSEELEAEQKALVPEFITPTQGRIMLKQMGLLDTVNAMVDGADDESLKIYWEYALNWERNNSYIESMANLLGMSEEQLDAFFIQAGQIN